jgi:hypothetical protein
MAELRLLAMPNLSVRLHVSNIAKTVEWVLTSLMLGSLTADVGTEGYLSKIYCSANFFNGVGLQVSTVVLVQMMTVL